MEATYSVLSPIAESGAELQLLANRLDGLDGKRIGLLDNSKEYAKVFLEILEPKLKKRFPGIKTFKYNKKTPERVEPELIQKIARECDAVVNGIGD